MTLLTTTSEISYAGTIGQTTFAYNFRVDLITDMFPTLDGVAVAQGAFTMTGLGTANGGNVVLNAGLVAAATVILSRVVPTTQEVDYQPFDAFPSETHEGALDKLTMLAQQNDASLSRSLRFPPGDTSSGLLPDSTVRVNTVFGFDANGDIDLTISKQYTQAEKNKLSGIETLADVTDATNVNTAGAVMHTDITPVEGVLRKTGAESYTTLKSNLTAITNPSVTDNFAAGYSVGSSWINTTAANEKSFVCVGDGVWVEGGSAAGAITSISGSLPVVIGGTAAIPDVQLDGQEMPDMRINNNIPVFEIRKANAAVDEGRFELSIDGNRLQLIKINDIGGAGQTILAMDVLGNNLQQLTLGGTPVVISSGNLQLGADLITATGNMINDADRVNNLAVSFTPFFFGETLAGAPTYTVINCYYYRIGNLVHIDLAITISDIGGMLGNFKIGGFPFNFHSAASARGSIAGSSGLAGLPATDTPVLSGLSGTTDAIMNYNNLVVAGSLKTIQAENLDNNTNIITSFTYITEDA